MKRYKYQRTRTHAIFNGIGARTRNGPSASKRKCYGFAADMRLRFRKMVERWVKHQGAPRTYQVGGGPENIRNMICVERMKDEFYKTSPVFTVSYYGTLYRLQVCDPYVVVVNHINGQVAAVFPIDPDMNLYQRDFPTHCLLVGEQNGVDKERRHNAQK